MILNLFSNKPVVEPAVHNWVADTFAWAITHLNGDFFKNDSQLILPTNKFYQGRVSSVHEMAQRVFSQTVEYAGMQDWPLTLVEPQCISSNKLPVLSANALPANTLLRGNNALINLNNEDKQLIEISYNPAQVNQPQDSVSSFAQILSSLLVYHAPISPPGGKEYIPQAIDLVACFMGFGVMFSNTAFQFKGGCGSCNNRQANRQSTLTELETVYCLAMFCQLKNINKNEVLPHLKGHLKKTFKQAVKQLDKQQSGSEALALLSLIK